jgi:hypothetical protein
MLNLDLEEFVFRLPLTPDRDGNYLSVAPSRSPILSLISIASSLLYSGHGNKEIDQGRQTQLLAWSPLLCLLPPRCSRANREIAHGLKQ